MCTLLAIGYSSCIFMSCLSLSSILSSIPFALCTSTRYRIMIKKKNNELWCRLSRYYWFDNTNKPISTSQHVRIRVQVQLSNQSAIHPSVSKATYTIYHH
eukprot:957489_1